MGDRRLRHAHTRRLNPDRERIRPHRLIDPAASHFSPASASRRGGPVARLLEAAIGGRVDGPLLLRPNNGQPMTRVAAARIVTRLAEAADIGRKVTPHDLRRGYVSGCLDAGVALRDAQTAARHADPRMTARYDRARLSMDRHANYQFAAFIAGAA